jgi:repressor LexA
MFTGGDFMIGERIKSLRKSKGIFQKDLAEKLEVRQSTVAMWETNKREPDAETIAKIADALGVTTDMLLRENGVSVTLSESNAQLLPSEYIRMIPCFESVSAGFGTDAQNRIIELIPLYIVNEQEAAETICITVRGDSMHPRIEDGDIVQVHKQDTAETGDIVVILDGDEAFVKRFIHGKNGVILESFNPAYPPMKFTKEESNRLRIVGVVKRIIRNL